MTAILTTAAVAVTLMALAYVTATDPKRRRAFKLPPRRRRFLVAAWLFASAPGVALLAAGYSAPFVLWLGATSIGGWLIAARTPGSAPHDLSPGKERVRPSR